MDAAARNVSLPTLYRLAYVALLSPIKPRCSMRVNASGYDIVCVSTSMVGKLNPVPCISPATSDGNASGDACGEKPPFLSCSARYRHSFNSCSVEPPSMEPIKTPSGRIVKPTNGRSWAFKKEKFEELVKDNRIWFGPKGNNIPSTKRFLSEVKNSFTPKTIWKYDEVGHNQDVNRELSKFYNMEEFTTPKPEKLLKRILTISSNESDWVLDAFAGSGTTAAVALKMKRKFIICEQMNYGKKIIIDRLKKVIEGEQGGISKDSKWKGGGGFCSYELKKLNIELIEKINKVNNTISLNQIIKDIQNHDYLSIQKDLDSLILSIKETNEYDLEFAKKALIEILDKSQLYLPYSEIEDAKHQINKSDVEINNLFYK